MMGMVGPVMVMNMQAVPTKKEVLRQYLIARQNEEYNPELDKSTVDYNHINLKPKKKIRREVNHVVTMQRRVLFPLLNPQVVLNAEEAVPHDQNETVVVEAE